MARVTILLTCYNHLAYLKPALEAVGAQTFGDYEILALDDGSTDGTRDWLTERVKQAPRLRCIFNEKNIGTYATLNVGLCEARGEYIAILNDDDLWATTKLERQVAELDANPKFGLVHTGGWFIDAKGDKHPDPAPFGFHFPRTSTGDILAEEIERNQIIASSVLVRRDAFAECREFNEALFGSGDWEMWLRIARRFPISFLDEPLTFYRVHGENASQASDKTLADDIAVREWITGWQSDYDGKLTPSLRNAFAHNWACLGTEYKLTGQRRKARQAFARSIRMLPWRVKSYLRWLLTFLP